MKHVTINNFGPVTHVSIPLNRIMVFMGPQSSGKSTVAKVISFCLWLEKDIVFHQEDSYVTDEYISEHFFDYFHVRKYLRENTEIVYESDCLAIRIEAESGGEGTPRFTSHIDVKADLSAERLSKNIYIPSERNIIGVQKYQTIKLPEGYMKDFVSDWLEIQEKFSARTPVDIRELGASFYYDENLERGLVKMKDCAQPFEMSEVSSGMQSVVPLLTIMDYMTRWIFSNRVENQSWKENSLEKTIKKKIPTMHELSESTRVAGEDSRTAAVKNIKRYRCVEEVPEEQKSLFNFYDRLSHPHSSAIVIEEPEQNLFPATQIEILYRLLSQIDKTRDTLIITTHSPFILYALNNCLLGYRVKDAASEIEDEALTQASEAWINPVETSVYEIKNGEFVGISEEKNTTIQDRHGLIRRNYFDMAMNGLMADFTNLLGLFDTSDEGHLS